MAGTVVDQFIVKLGLDPKEFSKGQKQAARDLLDLKKKAEEAGTGMGDALEAGAKRASGSLGILGSMLGRGGLVGAAIGTAVFLGKKLDDTLYNIAVSVRDLGLNAKNFGLAANGLRNLQNVSEMAGGSLQDATQTVADLQKSLFNLKFNGQVSDSLIMLSRLGVQFQDSYGQARDFKDVMLDTADALDQAQKAGRMTRPEAFQFAQQAGFTGGMANAVVEGRASVTAELAQQEARRQVTDDVVKRGTGWVRASTSMDQGILASDGNRAMAAVANTRADADKWAESTGKSAADWAANLGESISKFANAVDKFTGGSTTDRAQALASSSGGATRGTIDRSNVGATPYMDTIKKASLKYGVPEDVIIGMMRTESGFNPSAKSDKGATGLMQLMPETRKMLGIGEGNSTVDIFAATGLLNILRNSGLDKGLDPQHAMAYAVDAYHTGEGNIAKHTNIGPESLNYAGSVLQGTQYAGVDRPWMQGGVTNINIDGVTVQSNSSDVRSNAHLAGDMVKRKLLTAHAETGITP